ncbi:ubiquitin-2 like Rad60 SUMO-like-domain-containing protein [Neurospora tetraspora]|uniref:Ubiquitin-2 like Rad60 SUMO-like-domain-containing protein n=1 Tax=Neurospora tetraspora TaxID=94610 RepID=A0AAE0MPR7_9PEZI|nr:ubiquitin-2 like Rad60 SUMO-like-domain-containing protein [Neurospora tetraspora]
MDTATDVPKKRRALPFKRTVARTPVNEPPPSHAPENNSDEDDPLAFFRRSKDVFPMVLEDLQRASSEEKVKPSESPKEGHVNKKRRVSSNAEGDNEAPIGASSSSVSAPSRTSASRVDSDDDDLIMDVKGKGKEIVRPDKARVPTPRKPLSTTPRKLGTPSKKRFAFSDDEDDHGKDDLYSPHSKRRNPDRFSSKPTALGRSTRATQRGSSPLEGFETSFNLPGASSTSKRRPFQSAALDSDNDSDLEVSEVRPKKRSASFSSSPPPASSAADPDNEAATVADKADDDDDFAKWVTKAAALEADQANWTIDVLVTSRMPHTKPLTARRRMKQGLKLILDTWIRQQVINGCEIPEEILGKLFLTFKGNRIYSNSTIASLGVKVDANGVLQLPPGAMTSREAMDGYVIQGRNPGLVLEVWHEEFYEEELAKEKRRRERELGLIDDDEEEDQQSGTGASGANGMSRGGSEAAEVKKTKIRVVLKAKDLQPLKIAVYEDTPVGTMVQVFRKQRDIKPEQTVVIQFDGEELRENMLVGAMDIERDETNQFEVYIK